MNDNEQENFYQENKRIQEFLSYLENLKATKSELEANAKCKDIIYFFDEIVTEPDFLDLINWNLFIERRFFNIFPKLISAFSSHHSIVLQLIKLINAIFTKSILFCLKFINSKRGLQSFQFILSKKETEADVLIYLVANLSILSRYSEESIFKWKDLGIVNSLLECLVRDERLKRTIFQTIINVAQNEEANVINEICSNISMFKKIFEQAYQDFQSDTFNRIEKEFFVVKDNEICVKKFQVHVINIEYGQMTLTNLLLTLYRFILLCPDQNKKIYDDFNLKSSLKLMLTKGNLIEKKFCIKILGQLMFEFEIRNEFLNEIEFLNVIYQDLSKGSYEKDIEQFSSKVIKQCEYLVFVLSDIQQYIEDEIQEKEQKHLMISVHKSNLKFCNELKINLEKSGFRVWIDLDFTYDLHKVREAICNSFCIILCIDTLYRQSVRCHDEVEFALKLNKKILPLIIQNEPYEIGTDWLGCVIRNEDRFLDFSKRTYNFKTVIKNLVELVYAETSKEISTNEVFFSKKILNKMKLIGNWSEEDVKSWFEKNELSTEIFTYLTPFNGEILIGMYEMRCLAPHYFKRALLRIANFNDKSLGVFSFQLQKLFSI